MPVVRRSPNRMKPFLPVMTPRQVEGLVELVWPAFVELQGCIFAAPLAPPSSRSRHASPLWGAPDRTGAEAFHNHLHLLDLFPTPSPAPRRAASLRRSGFALGSLLGQAWAGKLTSEFPSDRFRVYLTNHEQPILRLHRVYPGEPVWLNEHDWAADIKRQRVIVWDTERTGSAA